tara:strand:+ start:7 stop:1332 length:1326 start_codon:yes stop_codon:yes gene_type:complete
MQKKEYSRIFFMNKKTNYLPVSIASGLTNNLGSILITFISIPIIINNIGLEDYGVWSITFLFLGLSSTFVLGLDKALVLTNSSEDHALSKATNTGSILIIQIILSLLFLSSILLFLLFQVPVFGNMLAPGTEVYDSLLISGVLIFSSQLFSSTFKALLEANLRIDLVNMSNFILTAVIYLTVLAYSYFENSIAEIILLTGFLYLGILFINISLVAKYIKIEVKKPSLKEVLGFLVFSKNFTILGVLNSVVQPANRYLFIFTVGNLSLLSIFDLVIKLSTAAESLMSAFSEPLYSLFSKLGMKRINEINKISKTFILILLIMYFLGLIIFIFLGELIANYFVGDTYVEIFYYSLLITLSTLLTFSILQPIVKRIMATGFIRYIVIAKIFQVPINLIALFYFSGNIGLIEFSIAYGLGFIGVSLLILLIYFTNYQKFYPSLKS